MTIFSSRVRKDFPTPAITGLGPYWLRLGLLVFRADLRKIEGTCVTIFSSRVRKDFPTPAITTLGPYWLRFWLIVVVILEAWHGTADT